MSTCQVLAGHQPAYLPWPGYLSRLLDLDTFLVLDHVSYSGNWQHRNYVSGTDGRRRLTVPIVGRTGQVITEAKISGDTWRARHWRVLQETYHRAPYWPVWEPRLAAIYGQSWDYLTDLNQALLQVLLDGFGIRLALIHSSDLRPAGAKTPMLIDLCRLTGTSVLRVGSGALGYLDFKALVDAGLGVEVATYTHPPYTRGREPFDAGLSALDLLLHQGPASRQILADGARTTYHHAAEATRT